MKKGNAYLLIFFLIASLANAQNFNLVSDKQVNLCPCSNQVYNILLQNTGSAAATYQITKSGAASGWVTITPTKLTLNPNTAANLQVKVSSPCTVKGISDLNIIADSSGAKKTLSQSLNFMACYNYGIKVGEIQDFEEDVKSIAFKEHENGYEVCEESRQIIPILIENMESYGNDYSVNLIGEEWSRLNANEFQLKGKQKGIVLLTLEPPKNSKGDYKLRLDAIARLGEVKKSSGINIKVDKCYELSLDIKNEKDILCGSDSKEYDVKIKNSGKFAETLSLNVTGADFASFANLTSIELSPGEEKTVKLLANPDAKISGNFNIKATASGKIKAEDSVSLEVTERNACYKADVQFTSTVKNKYSHEVFPVSIFNNGLRQASYKIGVEGPDWVSITPDELELKPGQRGNVNLDVSPNEDVAEGAYNISINAESNDEIYSRSVNIELKKENPAVKKIKATLKFYQYYIYLLIILIIIVLILWRPAKKRIQKARESYQKYKEKKENRRALEEERRARQEEIRKKKEEEKRRKEEQKAKKLEVKKKAWKTAGKKEKKEFFSKIKHYFIAFLIIAVIAALVFAGIYFKLFEKLPKKPYYALLKIIYGAYAYLYYILIGIALVAAFAFVFNRIKKKMAKADKAPKKAAKPFVNVLARIIILLLAAFVVLSLVYGKNALSYIKNFFVLYLYYFISGFVILIAVILLIRFYKPLLDFLLEEDKK